MTVFESLFCPDLHEKKGALDIELGLFDGISANTVVDVADAAREANATAINWASGDR